MNPFLRCAALLLCLTCISASSSADPITPFTKARSRVLQSAPAPTPAPLAAPRGSISGKNYVGFELGITSSTLFGAENFQMAANYADNPGNFFALDNTRVKLDDFQPGISFMANGVLDIAFTESVGLNAKVGYRQHKFSATGSDTVSDVTTLQQFVVDNTYTGTLNYLGVDALLRYQFQPDGIYGLLGLGFGSLLSNHNEGTQDLQESEEFGEFAGELDTFYNSSRFDVKLGIGTWIPLGDGGTMIAPELVIGIPVTGLYTSKVTDAYKAASITPPNMLYATLGIAIKFPFGGSSSSSSVASSSNESGTTEAEPGKAILRGNVRDAKTGEGLDDVNITVVDLSNNEVVAQDETDDGLYEVKVNAPGRYSVTADAPGYLFGTAYHEIDADGRLLRSSGDIKLAEASGRTRLLVFFDFNKADLQAESFPELNRATALMKANPSMEVEIAGFTDAVGKDDYNKDLSQRRANSVRDYLIRQGVEPSRIAAIGYGEATPIASNDTEEGRAENRRVEFVVIRR